MWQLCFRGDELDSNNNFIRNEDNVFLGTETDAVEDFTSNPSCRWGILTIIRTRGRGGSYTKEKLL